MIKRNYINELESLADRNAAYDLLRAYQNMSSARYEMDLQNTLNVLEIMSMSLPEMQPIRVILNAVLRQLKTR